MSNNLDFIPNREQIDAVMNQELTRRQFLLSIGGMLAAVLGISAFLRNMQSFGSQSNTQSSSKSQNSSYGRGKS